MIQGISGADFSAVLCYGRWIFGFVAYRDWTELLLGDETLWLHLPSWLAAVSFFALAATEWLALRWIIRLARRWWRVRGSAAA